MFQDSLEELKVLDDGRIQITVRTTSTMGKFFVIPRDAAQQMLEDLPSLLKQGGIRKYNNFSV